VRASQISGGGQWIDSERYDIEARAPARDANTPAEPSRLSREQLQMVRERLKSLLADRFQLAIHSETKEEPVYWLVLNKGGSKLRESTEPTGLIRLMGRGTLKGQAVEVGMLALNLSNQLGRSVIDKTGLAGKYDFELKWVPSEPAPGQLGGPPAAGSALPADPDGPSIFTALEEQLGLRLESAKGPVEVLVVDRAERPSKN
jgi:uncharacterized protein (TIGR03435 family)